MLSDRMLRGLFDFGYTYEQRLPMSDARSSDKNDPLTLTSVRHNVFDVGLLTDVCYVL